MLYVPVNIYGHAEMVISPNLIFSSASLTKQLNSTTCRSDNLESAEGRRMAVEIISCRHESMGSGPD